MTTESAPAEAGRSRDRHRPRRRDDRFDPNFAPRGASTPIITQALTLHAGYTQKVYKVGYPRVSTCCYFVLHTLKRLDRSPGREHATKADAQLREFVQTMDEQLTEELKKFETQVEEFQLQDLVITYSGTARVEVKYHTAIAGRFLDMLARLDRLLVALDKLEMKNYIDHKTKGRIAHGWQVRMLQFCDRLRELHVRAKAAVPRRRDEAVQRIETARELGTLDSPDHPAQSSETLGAAVEAAEALAVDVAQIEAEAEAVAPPDPITPESVFGPPAIDAIEASPISDAPAADAVASRKRPSRAAAHA